MQSYINSPRFIDYDDGHIIFEWNGITYEEEVSKETIFTHAGYDIITLSHDCGHGDYDIQSWVVDHDGNRCPVEEADINLEDAESYMWKLHEDRLAKFSTIVRNNIRQVFRGFHESLRDAYDIQ